MSSLPGGAGAGGGGLPISGDWDGGGASWSNGGDAEEAAGALHASCAFLKGECEPSVEVTHFANNPGMFVIKEAAVREWLQRRRAAA